MANVKIRIASIEVEGDGAAVTSALRALAGALEPRELDESAQAKAELVVCPVCNAEPGESCVSVLGLPFDGFHHGRLPGRPNSRKG